MLDEESIAICEVLLRRSFETLNQQLPEAGQWLFGGDRIDSFIGNADLTFSPGEPAVNVYSAGGCSRAHRDREALTILFSLSNPADFSGGGTGFWSTDDLLCRGGADPSPTAKGRDLTHGLPPSLVLQPPTGSALCFGGTVIHAAEQIDHGERCVFVASFTTKSGGRMKIEKP